MDSSPSSCGEDTGRTAQVSQGVTLRSMIMGAALCADGDDAGARATTAARAIDAHLRGVAAIIGTEYGHTIESKHAAREISQIVDMDAGEVGLACKRAALLYALHNEPLVQQHFRDAGDAYAIDLVDRVLPFTTPRFVHHGCQSPAAFVQLCVVLTEMWAGERMGNWPLRSSVRCARVGAEEKSEGSRGRVRTSRPPVASCTQLATANADAPPPAGSTATSTGGP